jgi:hypothetical protein
MWQMPQHQLNMIEEAEYVKIHIHQKKEIIEFEMSLVYSFDIFQEI